MEEVSTEMESLSKTGSKIVLLSILVSLMMIGVIVDLQMKEKDINQG